MITEPSYRPLWKQLLMRKMKKKDLMAATELSRGTMAKLHRDEPVNMEVILRICTALECRVDDVVKMIATEKGKKDNIV